MTIEEFIEARIAEDEQRARSATKLPRPIVKYPEKRPAWEPERWQVNEFGDLISENGVCDPVLGEDGGVRDCETAAHVAQHDPDQALRQAAALRAIVQAAQFGSDDLSSPDSCCLADDVLTALASIWSNHPDYRQKWES